MGLTTLQAEQVEGHYDEAQKILFLTYSGALSPDVTAQAYRWMSEVLDTLPDVNEMRGAIFDFQKVTQFDNGNLTSAQRQSQNLNFKYDLSLIPAALVVRDTYQERLLSVTMKISPQQKRKRIVLSSDAALKFINEFRHQHEVDIDG